MPCPHGQLDPFPGLGGVPRDPEHRGFGDISVPSPPWPSRRGGPGSSPGGRGRPSRRLGGTCLHWSSLVSPGGLAAARGRVLGAPELRSRRAGRSAWGTAGAEPVQCHGQAPGGGKGGWGRLYDPHAWGGGVIFSAPRCGFGVLWFLPWLARVRQGTGRCESDGGGIRCRLTSGGPGGVCGAPPGSRVPGAGVGAHTPRTGLGVPRWETFPLCQLWEQQWGWGGPAAMGSLPTLAPLLVGAPRRHRAGGAGEAVVAGAGVAVPRWARSCQAGTCSSPAAVGRETEPEPEPRGRTGAACVHTHVHTRAHVHARRPLPPPRPVTSVSRAAAAPSRPPLPLQPPPDTLRALLLVFLKLLFPRLLRTGLRWKGLWGRGAGGGCALQRYQPRAGGVMGCAALGIHSGPLGSCCGGAGGGVGG